MKTSKLFVAGAALALSVSLCGCGDFPATMNYTLSAPVELEMIAESYYTTLDEKGEEHVGTHTQANVKLRYTSEGDTIKQHRDYVIDNSSGYLKNYFPTELAWRAKSVDLKGVDRRVVSIEGLNEGYDSLVTRLPMPKLWREQLLNPDFKPHLARAEKHRWEMTHLLTGEIAAKGNITKKLQDEGRLNFALIQVDSVIVLGFENRDHRRCLDYVVFLKETESFPYFIWEQHVNSKIVDEKFKKYSKGLKAEYQTRYEILIDPTTGIPCLEHETKVGTHTMVNPDTRDTTTFSSLITVERLYNVKKPGEGDAE